MSQTHKKLSDISITSIGGAAQDVYVMTPHKIVEQDGQKFIQYPLGAKIKVQEVLQTPGGGALNTSVGFSRLGLSARFCGVIGDDEWGKAIQSTLDKEGVSQETAIIVEDEVSSFSIILIDQHSGQRTILYSPNVNAHLSDPVFPKEALKSSNWLFLNHLTDVSCVILDDLCDIIAHPSISFAWNPGGSQVREGFDAPVVKNILAQTDILLLNAEEAKTMMRVNSIQDALEQGIKSGVKNFCITDGAHGAHVSDGMVYHYCTDLPQSIVVDTTGAGDAFATGFVWGVLADLSLRDALAAGMINASSVVSYVGTQTGLLTETDIRHRLENIPLDIRTIS